MKSVEWQTLITAKGLEEEFVMVVELGAVDGKYIEEIDTQWSVLTSRW